ncbi:protease pro-enzyme activation domain-containing protein [Dyella sp. A6]|uniref:protease pro-enzyme activation domain-containing protein n=1 Tax=Dyella aluminiiresistens TaxID=3069105 RepID=UPI002E764AAB|nr:protease pro-enzyme activation domain-containing protein [Dyella sp. A6]
MSNRFRLKALTAAIGMAAAMTLCTAPASAAASSQAALHIIRNATRLHAGDKVLGLLSQSQPMNVAVSLKLRNKAELDAFVADPHHANLTPAQFMAKYGPTKASAQAVANFLKKEGFKDVHIAANRQLVTASGRADVAANAFHTSFVRVHTHDGRDAYATSSAVKIPASLQNTVLEVIGLQNVHVFHVLQPVHVDATGSATGHNPTDFATIYDAGSTATGSTVNVGVITEGSMTNVQSDFSSFLSQHPSLGSIPMNVVAVDGASSDTSGDGEWDLDTQDIAGMSGGVKAFYLYDTSSLNTQPLIDAFNKAVTDNLVRVINVSIGGCETGSETNGAATGDNIFEQADAQGQTFSVSSGDSGADECGNGGITPSWPADSQYVVAVGGTELYTSGTTWTNETVWNNLSSNEGATGGSPSTFEAQPSWQKNVGQNAGSSYRGVPDVAFDASPVSGATVIVDGANQQIGGTSLASPLFVGVWARTLATDSSLGFAAPLIYSDAASNYATDFHDVTSGNNNGETAATGWDYCTGFGSIDIANFVSHVAGSGSGSGGGTGGGGTSGSPVANFTYTASGLTASFTDSSSDTGGSISSYAWTFGDGGTSTSADPSHTYAAAGSYNVTETVTDSTGATSSKTESVTVSSSSNGGVFSNNTSMVINDNATVTSSINVSGESGSAPSALQVHVNITHNWSGDLEIVLYEPNGSYVVLRQPDYNNDGNIDTTYTVNASSVQGNGTWKLEVIDNDPWYFGDYGTLNNWSLTF